MRLREGCKSSVDLAFGAGFQDKELHPLCPSRLPGVFDRYVLSLDKARFAQSVAESGYIRGNRTGRWAAEDADYRHRLLLGAKGARHGHRATQQQSQLAAVHHSMTSSAVARI